MSASAVYEGWVRHRRFEPVEHSFRYRFFLMYLDLAELPGALDPYPLYSARRTAPARFRREAHVKAVTLKSADALGRKLGGEVRAEGGDSLLLQTP